MIEVNEYVRTKDGISKVIENVDKYVTEKQICVDFISGMYHQVISKHSIVKHSKQLIDLIEVGDIVNRHLIIDKYEDVDEYGNDFWCLIIEDDSLLNRSVREENIKTILTRESYMANCYKVGGEEDE
jgi:hypothetical protein